MLQNCNGPFRNSTNVCDIEWADLKTILLESKAMHKEEIVSTWHNGYDNQSPMIDEDNCGEHYYNETFNTKECYHKGKYTYNKETFECHKCGLIVPNEYRFNTKEK